MSINNQVFWYHTPTMQPPLEKDISTQILVIGGGMAGLTAAQSCIEQGYRVVLIEKYFCGAGASGKSSGFITPNSELSLSDLVDRFGLSKAQELWEFVSSGVEHIRATIQKYNLSCDYLEQDTLVVASSAQDFTKELLEEYNYRIKLHYPTQHYTAAQLKKVINAQGYYGGLEYPGSFSINGFAYCDQLKQKLIEKGLQVFEDTTALAINDHEVKTERATITAENIVVCTDWAAPALINNNEIYHVQTFLLLSEPLSAQQLQQFLPQKPYMMWDTELIYNYFRLTGDHRLLFGGATLWYTYAAQEKYGSTLVEHKVQRYIKKHFPQLEVTLSYMWPGMLGVSKDLLPIAGFDQPHIFYITAATGLPWAAALGKQMPRIFEEKDFSLAPLFSPERHFVIGRKLQKLLGKKISFALSHLHTVSSW